jgi:hypothetical protein
MVIRSAPPLPEDFETMAAESADQIRRFVLREVTTALADMPDALRLVKRLEWNSRRKTDFEIEHQIIQTLTDAGGALTFGKLQKETYTRKDRLTSCLAALAKRKKVIVSGSHRATRYRLP